MRSTCCRTALAQDDEEEEKEEDEKDSNSLGMRRGRKMRWIFCFLNDIEFNRDALYLYLSYTLCVCVCV